jgi:hypothetical protein
MYLRTESFLGDSSLPREGVPPLTYLMAQGSALQRDAASFADPASLAMESPAEVCRHVAPFDLAQGVGGADSTWLSVLSWQGRPSPASGVEADPGCPRGYARSRGGPGTNTQTPYPCLAAVGC